MAGGKPRSVRLELGGGAGGGGIVGRGLDVLKTPKYGAKNMQCKY